MSLANKYPCVFQSSVHQGSRWSPVSVYGVQWLPTRTTPLIHWLRVCLVLWAISLPLMLLRLSRTAPSVRVFSPAVAGCYLGFVCFFLSSCSVLSVIKQKCLLFQLYDHICKREKNSLLSCLFVSSPSSFLPTSYLSVLFCKILAICSGASCCEQRWWQLLLTNSFEAHR